MCFLFYTIPAERGKSQKRKPISPTLEDKIIRHCLFIIWGLLFVFGALSIIKPTWLLSISNPGKNTEALDIKNIGDQFLREKNYNMAVVAYNKALKIKPDMYSALGNLGIVYSKTGRYDMAIKAYKYLLKKDPKQPDKAYHNLAELYEKKGEINKAIEYYDKLSKSAPFAFYAYNKLGFLYLKKKEWEMAIKAFQNALKNKYTMKISYEGMLKRDLQRYSENPEISKEIQIQIEKGLTKKEIEHYDNNIFEKMLNRDTELAKTHNFIGFAFNMNNDFQNAIYHYNLALQIWPKFKEALKNLNSTKAKVKGFES
ncbi:MAG: tetratricopeptide repeat protein [Candidatus Cloacimonetes bacterium]|nr:tetratricopeptide repeat protein [Candidatus Cloacimonadota bacterium]MBL7086900.1 tetratricopeptide repeat protein [Candidatus Cloacimonadota bacterium]